MHHDFFHNWTSELPASEQSQVGPSRLDCPCSLDGSSEVKLWKSFWCLFSHQISAYSILHQFVEEGQTDVGCLRQLFRPLSLTDLELSWCTVAISRGMLIFCNCSDVCHPTSVHEELGARAWGRQGTRRAPKSKFVRVLTFFSCRWPVCIPDAFPTFIHVVRVPRKNINDFSLFLSGDRFSLPL